MRNVLWNQAPESCNIFPFEREPVPNRGLHDRRVQAEEGLRFLLHAGILACERGNEYRTAAVRVEFRVQRAEGEGGHLQRDERVADGSRAVFLHELRAHAAFDEDVEFSTARVGVWSVEATRTEEPDRHRCIAANKRRKGYAVGTNSGATQAGSGAGVGGRVEEIEHKVAILGDHRDPVYRFGGEEE